MQAIKVFSLGISAVSLSLIISGIVSNQSSLIYSGAVSQLVDVGLKINRRKYLEVAPEELHNTQQLLKSVKAERDAALQQVNPTTRFLIDTERQVKDLLIQELEESKDAAFEMVKVANGYTANLAGQLKMAAERIAQLNGYYYNLVQGRADSRRLFMSSLRQVERRLILVCPWIPEWLDDYVINELQSVLDRGVTVEVGWGHLGDVDGQLNKLSSEALLNGHKSKWYAGIYKLRRLTGSLTLKLIGTHEKYYIIDDQFCIIGSHNFLTSNGRSLEREVSVHTNNPQLVQQLIMNFDQSPVYY